MAQRTTVVLTDDIDGGAADETVNFSLDGKAYEIDLSSKNAKLLRDAMAPYASAGRRTAMSGKAYSMTRVKSDSKAIRAWGESNGYTVPTRGRLPHDLVEAFEKAN